MGFLLLLMTFVLLVTVALTAMRTRAHRARLTRDTTDWVAFLREDLAALATTS